MWLQPTSSGFLLALAFLTLQCSALSSFNEAPTPAPRSTGGSVSSAAKFRQNIAGFALNQKGARYKYGGRNPKTGFDCSGFTHYVFDNFGVSLTPVSRVQEGEGKRITVDNAQTGDLLFFRRSKSSPVFHVALVVKNEPNNLTVIHSTSSRGVIVENISNNTYWNSKITTARDILNR